MQKRGRTREIEMERRNEGRKEGKKEGREGGREGGKKEGKEKENPPMYPESRSIESTCSEQNNKSKNST